MPRKKEHASLAERSSDYCRQGEEAAHYMHGLADAFEAIGGESAKSIVHHLRCHASELNNGTLWVEHGYKER